MPSQLFISSVWEQSKAVAVGSMFKKQDGTVWSVGQNQTGNLGLGNYTTGIYTVTQVGTDTNWRSIESGTLHTMMLKNDNTLWTCGRNESGQLGNGTTTNTNLFAQVGTATNWAKVRCGRSHTLALTTNGTLWAWGDNTYGQLGDGTTTSRLVPTPIGSVCTLGVNEFAPKVMQLLTNPVQNQVQLSFAYDGVKQLSVYTMQGQHVVSYTVSQDYTSIDVSGFAAGVYIIECKSEVGNQVLKMVKE